MEIQQLRGFHAVAKYRNFTVAAKKTLRTQPTISLQVKALEDELKVRLFERLGPKQISLTDEGRLLYEITMPLIEQFDNVEQRFNESRDIYGTSRVTIVTHRAVMVQVLPNVVKEFKNAFPDCGLSILNRTRTEGLQMLDDGEADISITSIDNVPPHIDYTVISRFPRILIGNKDHPLASKDSISLKDIASYPLILPPQQSNTRQMIDSVFARQNIPYNVSLEVVGRDAIKTYVGLDMGLSIINEYYVTDEDKKKLFVKDLTRYFGKAETGIASRKGRQLSLPAREFIRMVKQAL